VVTLAVILSELTSQPHEGIVPYLFETTKEGLEPATRIERATCGLRISDNPPSDNLIQQETTTQEVLDMGPDGADLSCPGSGEVAETHADDAGFENPRAPKTIGHDLEQLHRSQSLVEETEESRQKSRSVTESYTV
jgi:hypothetical protein